MKGYIYKLSDGENDYYGSTILEPKKRFNNHKCNAINNCYSKFLNKDNLKFSIVEEKEIEDIKEIRLLEKDYIDKYKCINKIRPIISKEERAIYQKEYAIKNKNKICLRAKKYYQDNTDKVKNWGKEKVECECGAMTTKKNISRHKKSKVHLRKITCLSSS